MLLDFSLLYANSIGLQQGAQTRGFAARLALTIEKNPVEFHGPPPSSPVRVIEAEKI
jgi:hypothetical protein